MLFLYWLSHGDLSSLLGPVLCCEGCLALPRTGQQSEQLAYDFLEAKGHHNLTFFVCLLPSQGLAFSGRLTDIL